MGKISAARFGLELMFLAALTFGGFKVAKNGDNDYKAWMEANNIQKYSRAVHHDEYVQSPYGKNNLRDGFMFTGCLGTAMGFLSYMVCKYEKDLCEDS